VVLPPPANSYNDPVEDIANIIEDARRIGDGKFIG
jgi:hypothetical protein